MPLTRKQIEEAQKIQFAAAHDPARQVRVIAGPGTGKSSVLEERVCWLLGCGIAPRAICGVSFTRASALDLRQRIHDQCSKQGQGGGADVRITTLHSLALRVLRAAGLLSQYPADPLVLDDWELVNVFDEEFGHVAELGKRRREDVRRDHEAFWSTGSWDPPNYVAPDPPINASERARFEAFHGPRTQAYSCVLPGEIVRQCVVQMAAGTLNAVELLRLQHLVVDEFQDLNPIDLRFVDALVEQGAQVFVAGDDDQSIYSFRFASPAGLQTFVDRHPETGQHALAACFRSTPTVLSASQSLIGAYPQPNRIPKSLISLYSEADPPLAGVVRRWRFASGVAEARAIAESCRHLVDAGLSPRDILILVNNQRVLVPLLEEELTRAELGFELPREDGLLDSSTGRLVLALVRIACQPDDYVAHRVLLAMRRGVGVATCVAVTDGVISNNLNFRAVFHDALPTGLLAGKALAALERARAICSEIGTWQSSDTLGQRRDAITGIVSESLGATEGEAWKAWAKDLPDGTTLEEVRDLLWTENEEQRLSLMTAVFSRLTLPLPTSSPSARVRIMTMHGAKGLSAKSVFIPGLEDELLPGPWRRHSPGLVLEAARLLYVSITRARAACCISYARTRLVNGQFQNRTASRFSSSLGGPFQEASGGLTGSEVGSILSEVEKL